MNLKIFSTTTKDGIISKNKKYFPNLNTEEINLLYDASISRLLKRLGLNNITNIVNLTASNKEISSRVVTTTTKKVKEAILILKSTTPNVMITAESTDDPIIVASANKEDGTIVTAMALGTLENINNDLLHEMIESLIKETNAAPFEMTFYITACPSKENYVLENIDNLTNNYVWKDVITKKKKKFYIDLRYAIYNQLLLEIVDPNYIYFSNIDTVTDKNYYSDFGNKLGSNLTCMVYIDEKDV